MDRLRRELDAAREAARRAGAIVRGHYERGDLAAERKPDDSPVTCADLDAEAEILSVLRARFPDDAILSEESADDGARLGRDRVWIVDPLDGTRDFVARTGDFAVHVALAVDGQPAVAVVYRPIGDVAYEAIAGGGAVAVRGGRPAPLRVSDTEDLGRFRTGVTRFALTPAMERFLADGGLGGGAVAIGASIKMMAVAEGALELSLCLSDREKEWDSCAPALIVREAGGEVTDVDGAPLSYNRADVRHLRGIVMTNGRRHADVVAIARAYFAGAGAA